MGHNRFDRLLGRGDDRHRPIRPPILERSVLDIQNASAGRIDRRGGGSISDRDHAPACAKLAHCAEADITARCFPLKHDKSLKPIIIGLTTVDLELVGLNGDLVFARRRDLIGLDQLDVGVGSSILIEAAPPLLPACLMRRAGWLYSGLVALTSRTADADPRAPSFELMDAIAMVVLRVVVGSLALMYVAPLISIPLL
jgi:hypothetical protein